MQKLGDGVRGFRHPKVDEIWERYRHHHPAVRGAYLDAQWWIDLDVSTLKTPPACWRFVAKVPAIEQRCAGLIDFEAADYRLFHEWHGPMSAALLQLCHLIAFFAQGAPLAERNESGGRVRVALEPADHVQVLGDLVAVGIEIREHYERLRERGLIQWMPRHFRWTEGAKVEACNIVEFLNRHVIEFGGTAPRWATEEVPMEMPY